MKKDLYDLTADINSVSALVPGFRGQFDKDCDRLNDEYMALALYGISEYLERIAKDLEEIEEGGVTA